MGETYRKYGENSRRKQRFSGKSVGKEPSAEMDVDGRKIQKLMLKKQDMRLSTE
jgi:hypothetical protein